MTWKCAVVFLQIIFGAFASKVIFGREADSSNLSDVHIQMSEPSVISVNVTAVRLRWTVPDPRVVGVLVQFHTLSEAVTVSTSWKFQADASYTGTSAGLWVPLSPRDVYVDVYVRAARAANASVYAISYSEQDPVPGACNLEFRIENDPNIHLNFSDYETVVEFAPANIGVPRGQSPPPCDIGQGIQSRWQLTYEVYQYFLPEGDLSENTLFDGLKNMASVSAVKQHGMKVSSLSSHSKTQLYGHAFGRVGIITVVVVTNPSLNTSSLYVPASTYSCYFTSSTPSTCQTQGETFLLVFFTILGMCGLFVCFTGHRFLEAEYFFFGFLVSSFLCCLLMGRFSGQSVLLCLLYSAVAGWWGGFICALCRWRFGTPVLLTSLAGLVLGTLLMAVILITPLVNLDPLRSDVLYWICVSTGAFLLPVLMLSCTRALNMVASAIVGSYVAVLALGLYLHSVHPQIIVSALLRRALSPTYQQAILIVPFQLRDCLLTVLWGVLVVLGLLSQWRLTRHSPHFPPCSYEKRRQVSGYPRPFTERTPLLYDAGSVVSS